MKRVYCKAACIFLAAAVLIGLFTGCGKKEAHTLEVPEIDYTVPEWFRDAKFGVFIHYGVYSVPAFGDEWYGHWMYIPGSSAYGNSDIYTHHLETYGGAEAFGYKDFIPDFVKGIQTWQQNGGAEAWADLFQAAGARYVVPVAIHHDSYALYASDVQKTYNSVAAAGVDYVGALQAAVKARGMKFGVSNHFAENDWFFDEEAGKNTDLTDKAYAELYGAGGGKTRAHVKKWYAISTELMDKYRPDLLYYDFDLANEAFNTYKDANRYLMLQRYYAEAETWEGNEGVVCCNKYGAFTDAQALPDKERSGLAAISACYWQSDTSVGKKSWGYTTDEVYRSGEEFISALVDIVSKNGNLLLNVGPRADGSIPEDCEKALRTLGAWLDTYGDAIYATRPWLVYGEGNAQNEGDSYVYSGSDLRFTRSKDGASLYITALGTPENGRMEVKTLREGAWNAGTVASVSLLNGSERQPLSWQQTDTAFCITLPSALEGPCAVELTFKDGVIPSVATPASDQTRAIAHCAEKGLTVGTDHVTGAQTVCSAGDAYAAYALDFENDCDSLYMRLSGASEGKITLRADGVNGDIIGETEVSPSEDAYRSVFCAYRPLTGAHTLFLNFEGNIELSEFRACREKRINEIMEAEDCDLTHGSVRAEPCAEGGQNLGYVTSGDWAAFLNVDLGEGAKEVYLRLAGSGQSCRLRLDSPVGPVLAECGPADTGGWGSYETFRYDISPVSGVHDIYITYDTGWSDLNVNWLAFSDGAFTPDR